MIRVHIFSEGPTEDTFIREVLRHYVGSRVHLNSIKVKTSPTEKGGIVNYKKIKWQIEHKCKEDRTAFITTMFDLYKLPKDFPGYRDYFQEKNPLRKAELLEKSMEDDIRHRNFFANITVYEFEALLFSDPSKFGPMFGNDVAQKLRNIRSEFPSPEHINGGSQTAPSKRIFQLCPRYKKITNGTDIARNIGINIILEQCLHFKSWVDRLLELGEDDNGECVSQQCLESVSL